jgi:hypothetical protein
MPENLNDIVQKAEAEVQKLRLQVRRGFDLLGYDAIYEDLYNTGFIPENVKRETVEIIMKKEQVKFYEKIKK